MRTKLFSAALLLAALSVVMAGCELLGTKDLSADDAKMELRAAGDDINYNLGVMMAHPPMVALTMLSELTGLEIELKSDAPPAPRRSLLEKLTVQPQKLPMPGLKQVTRILQSPQAGSEKGLQQTETGIYIYNFNTGLFDRTSPSVSYIEYRFPADDVAYNARERNCILRIENLEIAGVYDPVYDEYEEIPVRFDAWMTIDGDEVMDMTYRVTLNNNDLPTSVAVQMNMDPYSLNLNYSGSSRNYSLVTSFKNGGTTLLATDLDIRYDASQEEVEKLDGSVKADPLEFKGSINTLAMEDCMDIDCMNDNIDVDVMQTELNKRIGTLEFRMYMDPYWEEEYAELAIVYKDGSYEFLFEVFEDMGL
jgi:hypothetical protein